MSNLEPRPAESSCPARVASSSPPAQTLLPREVPLGGPRAITVLRTLPHKEIRTIGPWCFVDHAPPVDLTRPDATPVDVPPHPHMGLQTVTWLLDGEVEHRDSVGHHQVVRPGQTNVMTAGHGISHSEYSVRTCDRLFLLQLWIALPDNARHIEPHFEHHSDLPRLSIGDAEITLITGRLAGTESPAAAYSPLVGAQVTLPPGGRARVPLEDGFEHGVLVADGEATIGSESVGFAGMRYLGWGSDHLDLASTQGAVLLLLGGEPLAEDLLMWWNFVGRDHDEIVTARQDWEASDRFGTVVDDDNPRIPAPPLPKVRLRPRPSRPG
jgi:redox-sensitive bicupin YhaK (pirin superfamily)